MLTKAQQKLVTDNMGIAIRVLTRLNVRRGPGYDDCRSEAMLALCKAAVTFDPSQAGFSTWAWLKVSGAVKDWMDREARLSWSGRDVVSLEEAQPDVASVAVPPDELAYHRQVETRVRDALVDSSGAVQELAEYVVFGEFSTRESALAVNVSVKTAQRHRTEARRALADIKYDLDLDSSTSAALSA